MIGTYHYAFAHPMKPLRVAMTDEIVKKYELDKHFDTIVPIYVFRICNLPSFTATTPTNNHSLLSILISTLTLFVLSLLKTEPTMKINSTDSISKRIVLSWRDSMIIVSVILQAL